MGFPCEAEITFGASRGADLMVVGRPVALPTHRPNPQRRSSLCADQHRRSIS
jgi:hypothetical protein